MLSAGVYAPVEVDSAPIIETFGVSTNAENQFLRTYPESERLSESNVIVNSDETSKTKIIQKILEVPRIREVVKTVPVKRVVEVQREHIEHVSVIETKTIEKEVEVMGNVIEVSKPFLVENRVIAPRFIDEPVPTVVTQTLKPCFVESEEYVIQVRLREYEPEVIPVDIFLPKPIDRNIVVPGNVVREHIPVSVPMGHYNSLITELNQCKKSNKSDDPTEPAFWTNNMLATNAASTAPVLLDKVKIIPPNSDDWKQQYDASTDYILKHNEGQLSKRQPSFEKSRMSISPIKNVVV